MLQASKCTKLLNRCGQKNNKNLPEHKEKTKVEFKWTKHVDYFVYVDVLHRGQGWNEKR